jgi:Xaa-Pro aminopeptidase
MTELQAAWLIEEYMRRHGAERLAFDSIVASGPNAAKPHAEPGERELRAGEPITIDIGARVEGYNSDMTRTITLGHATEKFNEIYNIVLKAQQAVEKKARVGMSGKQVDRLARRIIEKAGYEKEFGHGVGHGVGRMVHEFPRAGKTYAREKMEPNMLLTVEPGIYIPGWGGVRIEDLVVFRDNGVQVLTEATKDPLVLISV